ncbi:hypothetical protein [Brevibacillus sp. NRS-1366]|uniref:hypothetical protein n=1 Tax=Brevibacillus sp. NRS-1366 TaxID=3233899 RepID=UPI003D1E94CB
MRLFKKAFACLLVTSLVFSLLGCSSSSQTPSLEKTSGAGFARSEHHPFSDDTKKITYYKPMSVSEIESLLPSPIQQRFYVIGKNKLPFPVDKEAAHLIAFSYADDKTVRHQLQLTYKQDRDNNGDENFFVIRMTETDENPLSQLPDSANGLDTFGNIARMQPLRDDVSLIHHIIQTNSAYVYSYYDYNEKDRAVHLVTTNANEINFYDRGIFYQIAYHVKGNEPNEAVQTQMVALAKELAEHSAT